jgi:hypothetical protein
VEGSCGSDCEGCLCAARCCTTCPKICVDGFEFVAAAGGLVGVVTARVGRGFRRTGEFGDVTSGRVLGLLIDVFNNEGPLGGGGGGGGEGVYLPFVSIMFGQ